MLLADAYKSFARRFELYVKSIRKDYPHDSSYGYVRGRNTIDNAKGHCLSKQILHADIEDFFPSISRERIASLFINLGLRKEVSEILSQFVTIEETLPLGLHPSPLLANLICLNLDIKFKKLSDSYGCYYTRYADDISISGNGALPTKEEIKTILSTEAFRLSERKFRITKPGQAHYVTGLSVSDENPRAPRRMKRQLKQELYYCKKFGIENHLTYIKEYLRHPDGKARYVQRGVNRIDGTVRYISNIEHLALPQIRNNWKSLLKNEGLRPSYPTLAGHVTRCVTYYVDETEITYAGKNYLALSFIQTEDPNHIEIETAITLRAYLASPFVLGDKEALRKKGLHHADADQDLRETYIKKLTLFPFRAYLVYGQLSSKDKYEDCFLDLTQKILWHRLMGCDGAVMLIIFEENSKVRRKRIESVVGDIYNSLKETDNRRPALVRTMIAKKSEAYSFSVPDFMLGIFSRYARYNASDEPKMKGREKRFFESLRDKYRVILDADTNIIYSRKRPFEPWA